ncbi:MAG: hypothetical protein QM702_10465 [Rubrivivax sp.]
MRRNKLADFIDINKNGKIAMKLDEGDGIVDVDDLHRQRRRAADHRARPVHPLPGRRRPRVQGP